MYTILFFIVFILFLFAGLKSYVYCLFYLYYTVTIRVIILLTLGFTHIHYQSRHFLGAGRGGGAQRRTGRCASREDGGDGVASPSMGA